MQHAGRNLLIGHPQHYPGVDGALSGNHQVERLVDNITFVSLNGNHQDGALGGHHQIYHGIRRGASPPLRD